MKQLQWMCAALAAAVCSGLTTQALASSHSEAPGTASDPDIDNADTWAWVDNGDLIVVATYNGLQPPFAAPNWKKFADNALYEIHLSRGDSVAKDVTYRFEFTTNPYPIVDVTDEAAPVGGGKEFFAQLSGGGAFSQTYSVTRIEAGEATVLGTGIPVAPPNVGPNTNAISYELTGAETYEEHFVDLNTPDNVVTGLTGGGEVFAGPRDDAFYVDLGSVFDLANLRGGLASRNSTDYTNVQAIALSIPVDDAKGSAVGGTPGNDEVVGVWASASRRKVRILRVDGTEDNFGPWRQVSRLGLPLINEAVIGLQDKDYWNRLDPADDLVYFGGYILNPTVVRVADFAGLYGTALAGCIDTFTVDELKFGRMDLVPVINIADNPTAGAHSLTTLGDVLRVDLAVDNGTFPNGRSLMPLGGATDFDVTDIVLTLVLCPEELATSCGAGACAVGDGVADSGDSNTKVNFPYLATPWESFEAGVYEAPN